MKTTINSEPAEWPPRVRELWDSIANGRPEGEVISANYFTPRPRVDEYSQPSDTEGFIYIIGREVYVWQRRAQ